MNQSDTLAQEAAKYFRQTKRIEAAVKKAMSNVGSYYPPKKDKENGK